jgi:hypothetical protein
MLTVKLEEIDSILRLKEFILYKNGSRPFFLEFKIGNERTLKDLMVMALEH